jgi:putative SOS response-associated peptidase YedK
MCNLYSITTNQAAIIALFRVVNRYVGNLPPMPGVFPDYPAPVVRKTETGPHRLGSGRSLAKCCAISNMVWAQLPNRKRLQKGSQTIIFHGNAAILIPSSQNATLAV